MKSRTTPITDRPRLLAGVLAALALIVGACNILGPALYLAHGPAKQDPVHALAPQRPTVLFIDDRSNRIPRRVLRVAIGEEAERILLEQDVVERGRLISAQSALAAASRDRFGDPMPISEIGAAVGAEVVVYVAVDEFTLSPDGQTFSPAATMRVKVIDAANEARLWPGQDEGHRVSVRMPIRQGTAPTSVAGRMEAEQELAVQAGRAIARLFYKHEVPQSIGAPAP